MEKLPGQLGFLILNEDGAVVNSGGDLENDERVAAVLFSLVNTASKRNLVPSGTTASFHRMSVHYGMHTYSIALSNKKFHIVKRKYQPTEPVMA